MLEDLPSNVLMAVLKLLNVGDLLSISLASKKIGEDMRAYIMQMLLRKKSGLPYKVPLGWMSFPYQNELSMQRLEDASKVLRHELRTKPDTSELDKMGFDRQLFEHTMEDCCSNEKILALCNPQGSNVLAVLTNRTLKIFQVDMLSRLYPVRSHYHHWNEPAAHAGELISSPGGSKILVWRWMDAAKKIIKLTLIDVLAGCIPISCLLKAPEEEEDRYKPRMLERLRRATIFAWVGEHSLLYLVDGRPEILHFFNDGGVTRELMSARVPMSTSLTAITSATLILECWTAPEPREETPLYHLLAGTHCNKEGKVRDCNITHRLVVFTVRALQIQEMTGFYFSGELVDLKSCQDLSVAMVKSSSPEMPTRVNSKCSNIKARGCAEEPGYLYFYRITKKNWQPEFLFRSPDAVFPDLSCAIGNQWSINEVKMVFRTSSLSVTEAPLYWDETRCAELLRRIPVKCSSVAMGCHGDFYSSRGSKLRRHTALLARKYQKFFLVQCLTRC